MKVSFKLAVVLSMATLVSCSKVDKQSYKIDLPEMQKVEEIKTVESLMSKNPGFKCDLVGLNEHKEVFLKVTTKDDEVSVSIHDFTSASQISISNASFDGFTIMSIKLNKATEDDQTLTGESVLLHSKLSTLSDEGKVLLVTGRISLNEDMSGSLQTKLLISKEDQSIESTEFKELAKIENCEAFEASSF